MAGKYTGCKFRVSGLYKDGLGKWVAACCSFAQWSAKAHLLIANRLATICAIGPAHTCTLVPIGGSLAKMGSLINNLLDSHPVISIFICINTRYYGNKKL